MFIVSWCLGSSVVVAGRDTGAFIDSIIVMNVRVCREVGGSNAGRRGQCPAAASIQVEDEKEKESRDANPTEAFPSPPCLSNPPSRPNRMPLATGAQSCG
jgi:hypothetical protein